MNSRSKAHKTGLIIGGFLYILGLLIGTAFNLRVAYGYIDLWSFWGYPEPIDFDYSDNNGELAVTGFQCPLLLTPGETGNFSIRVRNKTDQPIQPVIQILVGERERKDSYTRLKEEFSLAPGETKEFSQTLVAESNMLNDSIKVRIFFATGRLNAFSISRHCPVFVHRLGNLHGTQILILISSVMILLVGGGLGLFWRSNSEEIKRTPRTLYRMIGLAAFIILAMASNLIEWYFLALMWFLLEILLILSIFESDTIKKIFQ